nr:hypothetical protein [Tanacetum cinerariifolium]
MVPSVEWRILLLSSRRAVKKGSSQDEENFAIFFHFRITESARNVNLPTSTSIFSAILIGYWIDRSANLMLILVGLRVLRDSFAYKEYGIRLMLAPRFIVFIIAIEVNRGFRIVLLVITLSVSELPLPSAAKVTVFVIDDLVFAGNKMLKSFPLPVIEFPLPEQFPTASEDMFPLLVMRLLSATITLSNKVEDPISRNIKRYQSLVRSFDQEKNNIQPQQKKKMVKSSTSSKNEPCCSKACKKNTDSLNSKITDLSEKLGDGENMLYHYKLGLSQVEARLVEFKNQEIKFSSKDLDNLLESQRTDKNKKGLGYSVVPPSPAQVYSPPKKDMSWTGLPEFADNTITDYSRPSPAIERTKLEDTVRTKRSRGTKSQKVVDYILQDKIKLFIKKLEDSEAVASSLGDDFMEFPLPEQFPTASEDMFPLLVMRLLSATITLSNKVEDPISGNIKILMFPEIGSSTLLDKVIVALSNLKGKQYEKLYIKVQSSQQWHLFSSAGATHQLSSGNTFSLAVGKGITITSSGNISLLVVGNYSGSRNSITGSENDLSILFPTILP